MADEQDFRLEEYKALRKEVELYLTEGRAVERYTVIAVGAIWAWLIGNRKTNDLLWLIPAVVTLAATLQSVSYGRHLRHIGIHLRTIEKAFGVEGWESTTRPVTLGFSNGLLAFVLLAISIAAWFFHCDLIR